MSIDLPTELYIENATLREQNLRMRDYLLALAKECIRCHGTGLRTLNYVRDGIEMDADDQPCPDCAEIRAVLE